MHCDAQQGARVSLYRLGEWSGYWGDPFGLINGVSELVGALHGDHLPPVRSVLAGELVDDPPGLVARFPTTLQAITLGDGQHELEFAHRGASNGQLYHPIDMCQER